jgi:hypothetical protein
LKKKKATQTSFQSVFTEVKAHELLKILEIISGEASPTFGHANANSNYRLYKESISKEMNNNGDLNLHLHDQKSGWLRQYSNLFMYVV